MLLKVLITLSAVLSLLTPAAPISRVIFEFVSSFTSLIIFLQICLQICKGITIFANELEDDYC